MVDGHSRDAAVIEDVARALAEVRGTTPETIVQMVQTNFARIIQNDPWLPERFTRLLAGQPNRARAWRVCSEDRVHHL